MPVLHRPEGTVRAVRTHRVRHEVRSTPMIRRLPVEKWYGAIRDSGFADSIPDWFAHNAGRIGRKGDPMRKRVGIVPGREQFGVESLAHFRGIHTHGLYGR